MNRKEIERKLINRAWQDDTFKRSLIADPEEAIRKEGIDLPGNIEIKVVEETLNIIYLVIPQRPEV
jgi:hypothetical protein